MTNAGNDWWWAIDNVRVAARFNGNPLPGIADSDVWNFSTVTDGIVLPGDIDGDGEVQFSDFVILANNFGRSIGDAGLLQAVPQPSSVDVLFARTSVGAEEGDGLSDELDTAHLAEAEGLGWNRL
jgi:hypothetical protein